MYADKTQVFHDKIQVKQKELQPWTAQINEKQASIDVATSERDALAKKAEALKAQCTEAADTLKALLKERETKARHPIFSKTLASKFFLGHSRRGSPRGEGSASTERCSGREKPEGKSHQVSTLRVIHSFTV